MDNTQNDHLKSYGLVYYILEQQNNVEWLLNYKGGSFLFDYKNDFLKEAQLRGISTLQVSAEYLNKFVEAHKKYFQKVSSRQMDLLSILRTLAEAASKESS